MKDGEELQVTCTRCGDRVAFRRRASTTEGIVWVTYCVKCDRGRCTSCNHLLPGEAAACRWCGSTVAWPADDQTARAMHPAGHLARLAEAERLVAALVAVEHHPELPRAQEALRILRLRAA